MKKRTNSLGMFIELSINIIISISLCYVRLEWKVRTKDLLQWTLVNMESVMIDVRMS